ncbi:unnamed protein product, partial [Didymodactylos carnosus]
MATTGQRRMTTTSSVSQKHQPRRYVLDDPYKTNRRQQQQTTRIKTNRNTNNMRGINNSNDSDQQQYLSRSGSSEYLIRNGQTITATEYGRMLHDSESSSGTATRYIDDNSIRQMLETDENGEQLLSSRSLTSSMATDVRNYPINIDPNPELIVRPNTQRLTYTHDVAVRYLRPPTPPPPGVR